MLAVVGGAITWWVNQSGGTYASRAADIVNATTQRMNTLESESKPDQTLCESGSLSACDRVIAMLSTAADEVATTRAKLQALEPPAEAQSWHSDYIAFLQDAEYALRRSVNTWNQGDLAQFEATIGEFDSLATREDQLTTYFNDHLR